MDIRFLVSPGPMPNDLFFLPILLAKSVGCNFPSLNFHSNRIVITMVVLRIYDVLAFNSLSSCLLIVSPKVISCCSNLPFYSITRLVLPVLSRQWYHPPIMLPVVLWSVIIGEHFVTTRHRLRSNRFGVQCFQCCQMVIVYRNIANCFVW